MAAFGDGDGIAHLDDTDLVRLNHHLPKLRGDQDVTLLWDCRNKQKENVRRTDDGDPTILLMDSSLSPIRKSPSELLKHLEQEKSFGNKFKPPYI